VKLVTVEQMRAIEREADASGLSYATMMDNAGRAVARWIEQQGAKGQSVVILVGPGNNGGDGLVAARYLQEAGAQVSLYVWKRDVDRDPNWDLAQQADIPSLWIERDRGLAKLRQLVGEANWVVDALLGTGATRPISGKLKNILATVSSVLGESAASPTAPQLHNVIPRGAETQNSRVPRVVAVDVPSGLNCDTGAVDPATLHADATVTFAFAKIGQFLFPGASYLGQLVIADIAIPPDLAADVPVGVTMPSLVRSLLPVRPLSAHKGTFGKVMVVAGSPNYTGAAYLAASAAARAGAGLVTLGIAESLHPILANKLCEATFLLLPHETGVLVPSAVRPLREGLADYDALLIGPGLGRDEKTAEFVAQLIRPVTGAKKAHLGFVTPASSETDGDNSLPPLVVDADGLNALAEHQSWPDTLPPRTVLTPHPGEMARLMGSTVADVEADRLGVARHAAAAWDAIVVLKGAYTVIAAPPSAQTAKLDVTTYVNPFANPALASAGSGDVLAGTIASLLAQGLAPLEASIAGAYLHGLAGELVREESGAAGAVASDLLPRLPASIRRVASS
jgi:NAD(P)H-hydrate epimerase